MPISKEILDTLEREWLANRARQRLQTSMSLLETGEFTLELVPAPDDPNIGEPAFQQELGLFTQALHKTGVSYSQTGMAMDAVDAQGFPLPEFIVVMKTLGPPVIAAVVTCATAWARTRMGRKVRIRVGEFEADGYTAAEIETLLRRAAEFQNGLKAGGEEPSSKPKADGKS
jgi:hypothetical protein